jgi:hypothetical protein
MERALSLEEFGRELLSTGDLDPVYTCLNGVQLSAAQKKRLCLAYWCFYHLGVAAKLSAETGPAFWEALAEAAANVGDPKPWPRGAERRHFRGQQAIAAVVELRHRYARPEHFCDYVFEPGDGARPTYGGVAERVKEHRGFGPWIAFKIADMGERVFGYPVDFSDCELGIYKDPRQGAALVYVQRALGGTAGYAHDPWRYPITDQELRHVVAELIREFRKTKLRAPPTFDREVNVQEIETILCKYKSHVKGHYPSGKDTRELAHGLSGWGPLAEKLKKALTTHV